MQLQRLVDTDSSVYLELRCLTSTGRSLNRPMPVNVGDAAESRAKRQMDATREASFCGGERCVRACTSERTKGDVEPFHFFCQATGA